MNTTATPAAITPEQAIGQIAVDVPGASAVFRRLKIDFCCGGQISLADAVAEKGLELGPVIDELAALKLPDDAPQFDSPSAMIDHIISRYHDVHRAQLPELIIMAQRVEQVHQGHPNVPKGLTQALMAAQGELVPHMQKEELVLFPSLKRGGNAFISQPIAMMRMEHTDHGAQLEEIERLTNDMQTPAGACSTWQALYSGLQQFRDDLINHIHLENNILFPIFEQAAAEDSSCSSGGCGC